MIVMTLLWCWSVSRRTRRSRHWTSWHCMNAESCGQVLRCRSQKASKSQHIYRWL